MDWEYICIIRDSTFRLVHDCLTGPLLEEWHSNARVILDDGRVPSPSAMEDSVFVPWVPFIEISIENRGDRFRSFTIMGVVERCCDQDLIQRSNSPVRRG